MKVCSRCGAAFGDDKLSCPYCGGAPGSRPNQQSRPNTQQRPGGYQYGGQNMNQTGGFYKVGPTGDRIPDWYESTWFIVLTGICGMWPVTIAMIALRVYRSSMFESMKMSGQIPGQQAKPGQQTQAGQRPQAGQQAKPGQQAQQAAGQNGQVPPRYLTPRPKARGIGKLIGGSLLGGFGLLSLAAIPGMTTTDLPIALTMSAMFIAAGAILIGMFTSSNKNWAKYEALIDNRGNTKISSISAKLHKDTNKVRTQLQKMINKGFLSEPENGISAYINGEYDLLVMTHNGKPIVPIEQTMAEEIAKRKSKEEAERAKAEAAAEKAKRDAAKTPEERFLYTLKDAIAYGGEDEAVEYLKNMRGSVANIRKLLAQNPEDCERKSIKNMRESYIPSTVEMINKYFDSTTSEDMKAQIRGMFSTMATAYKNIESQLREQDDIDMGIDIEVMRQTLAREGLLDSDFNIKV